MRKIVALVVLVVVLGFSAEIFAGEAISWIDDREDVCSISFKTKDMPDNRLVPIEGTVRGMSIGCNDQIYTQLVVVTKDNGEVLMYFAKGGVSNKILTRGLAERGGMKKEWNTTINKAETLKAFLNLYEVGSQAQRRR